MSNNVIVSPHYLSSEAGKAVFKLGGNAIDAAIAVNIVQGVVAPETCGIGGDLFALIWIDGEDKPYCLDSSGYAGSNVENIEVIIVDNGSTDSSVKMIKNYCSKKLKSRFILCKQKGPAAARNIGLQFADGDFI